MSAGAAEQSTVPPLALNGAAPEDRPRIKVGTAPETIRVLVAAIDGRVLPDIYVTDGSLARVEVVSGAASAAAGDEDSPLPVTATAVTPPVLADLLAHDTYTFRVKTRSGDSGEKETYDEETTPTPATLAATLARKTWPGVPPLRGIVGAPVLRPDGTLLQRPGYDEATGLYLASRAPLDPVPDAPTAEQVEQARHFIFGVFLRDFPWVADADRANYAGVLVTPILRRYLRVLTPFVVLTATMPASGKTILTSGPGMLYGQRVLTWTHDDAELRKSITAVLADPVGTVIFDNLGEGASIDSPVLARLITDRTWADRLLGGNRTASYANDRLWMATGNNLRLGGDMATRTVMVRLDPDMPHPEERGGFALPHLDTWICDPVNQRRLLWHLLVLVVDWTRAGSPRRRGARMRQFTPWAEAVGGFLDHHGITGFLGNVADVREADDEDATWAAFLARWHSLYGTDRLTARELRRHAEPVFVAGVGEEDRWDGLFLTDHRGKIPNEMALARRMTGHVGRWHGSFVLRRATDPHSKVRLWWVETASH